MYSRLSYISDLLSSDRASPLGPSPNLLPVHYHLSELETFRNETLAQAKRHGDSTSKATLEQYFERLGSTIADFEEHYFHLASNLLELARKGNARVAVKIAKIAEVEGARDQKAIAIRMVKKSGNVDVAARFRSLQADARTIKHYRSKVVDAIRESCKAAVERSFQKYGEDIVAWLDDIDWLYDDLQVVVEELAPCFPPDWNVRSSSSLPPSRADPSLADSQHLVRRSSHPLLLVLTTPFAASRPTIRLSTTSSPSSSRPPPAPRPSSASPNSPRSTSRPSPSRTAYPLRSSSLLSSTARRKS